MLAHYLLAILGYRTFNYMACLFFMDESGHDHVHAPYEVRGGFALHDERLWPFIRDIMSLEISCLGARLMDYKSEIKGRKLLQKDRFRQLGESSEAFFEPLQRQRLCRSFLQAGLERRSPTKEQFTAYAQAAILMADGIFDLLERSDAKIFASAVPRGAANPPASGGGDMLRKDHIFLFERFFYFLEKGEANGLVGYG